MRSRTPRPAERASQKPGPNDQAYLDYGSLSESASRGHGSGSSGGRSRGPKRQPWAYVVVVVLLMAVPYGLLVLASMWNAPEDVPTTPAELVLLRASDVKDCEAKARVQTANGSLRQDPRARKQCLVDRGWRLNDRGDPVECVGRCAVRQDGS